MTYLYPLLAYLIGSIPFGVIFTRLWGKGNLQKMGSGNIGATNVVRTQGKTLGALTFLCDFIKGVLPCYFLQTGDRVLDSIIYVMPLLGHVFPIWLKFKGGKGVSTYFGILLVVGASVFRSDEVVMQDVHCPMLFATFLATLFIWFTTFMVTKISAVASITSCLCSVIIFYYVCDSWNLDFVSELYALIIAVAVIVIRHHTNVKQLLR